MFSFFIVSSICLTIKPSEEKTFLHWMRETKHFYIGSEYHFRFGIWLSNFRFIQSKNAAEQHFKCGLNSFAALTPTEYRLYLNSRPGKFKLRIGETLMKNSQSNNNQFNRFYEANKKKEISDPDELDYRKHDPQVLNAIQDVGSCSGSDWAFAVTACVETNYALSGHKTLYKLSEQCLIDCVEYCDGCNSCEAYSAFTFITGIYQTYLNLIEDYPWTGSKGTCNFNKDKSVSLYSGVAWGHENPETDMIHWLNTLGIGAIRIDASSASFQLYTSGIYDDKNCGTNTNLDLNVVGYGNDSEGDSAIPYWICRNSWGTSWGEEGYFRILRGVNECGITTVFGFPAVFT